MNHDVLKDNIMHSGKVATAVQCLRNQAENGVLDFYQKIVQYSKSTVLDILKEKQPPPHYFNQIRSFQIMQTRYSIIYRSSKKMNASAIKCNSWQSWSFWSRCERMTATSKTSSSDFWEVIVKIAIKIATA